MLYFHEAKEVIAWKTARETAILTTLYKFY